MKAASFPPETGPQFFWAEAASPRGSGTGPLLILLWGCGCMGSRTTARALHAEMARSATNEVRGTRERVALHISCGKKKIVYKAWGIGDTRTGDGWMGERTRSILRNFFQTFPFFPLSFICLPCCSLPNLQSISSYLGQHVQTHTHTHSAQPARCKGSSAVRYPPH